MLPSPISRRRFSASLIPAGALLLISRRARAAQFELRQFHNQPAESPLHKRLVEMWAVVKAETHGRIQVETFAENDRIAGGDPAALRMLIDGRLDFFTLNGGLIGTVVPAVDVQGIPARSSRSVPLMICAVLRSARQTARSTQSSFRHWGPHPCPLI
jgi:TRAP-type C4-dicarboxylate transport system substrate-binding protein